jgi:cobalt/nickel transport system ATP-binding protein
VKTSSLFALLLVLPLAAQAQDDSLDAPVYETVVVSGRKLSRDRTQEATEVDGQQLRDSPRATTFEALSQESAGVYVPGRGAMHGVGNGATGGLHVRDLGGSPNSQVLVVEDGVPDYQGIFGHPIPDAYVPFLIDDALVVKGGDSVLFGTNAMGGVVVLRSRWREREGYEVLNDAGGSHSTLRESGSLIGRFGSWDVAAGLHALSTEGHRMGAGGDELASRRGHLRTRRGQRRRHGVADGLVAAAGVAATDHPARRTGRRRHGAEGLLPGRAAVVPTGRDGTRRRGGTHPRHERARSGRGDPRVGCRMTAPALVFSGVAVRYEPAGDSTLREITFSIAAGERVALVGLNGSGKTTLLMTAVGLVPHEGEVQVGGVTLSRRMLPAIRDRVGFLFNVPEDQLLFPKVIDDDAFSLLRRGLPPREATAKAGQALRSLGIAHLAEAPLHLLSHGQKQRVALAGALAADPPLLLLDEPSAGLDPPGKRTLAQLLGLSAAMVVATHDLDFAKRLCSRFLMLEHGRIAFDGAGAEEVLRRWELRARRLPRGCR